MNEEYLKKLGLTDYEIKVYNALLLLGKAKSRAISKKSNVSYGRIYEILEKLTQKGLIITYPTIPKQFEAIDSKTAIYRYIQRKKDKLIELEDIPEFPINIFREEDEQNTIILEGKKSFIDLLKELRKKAKKEILHIPGEFNPDSVALRTIKQALDNDVEYKLLAFISELNKQTIDSLVKNGLKFRTFSLPGLRLFIVDRKEAVISIVGNKRISIHTTNKSFAKSMALFFDFLWQNKK